MRWELHCHSLRSDGGLAPARVAERAKNDGARVFCLTDHDTTAGYAETLPYGGDMQILRGLELSCTYKSRSVHILVYDIESSDRWQTLETALAGVARARQERIRTMAARLAERGIEIDADAILERAQSGKTVGRPDVARALVEVGAVRSMREAFDRYLHDGGPIDVPSSRLGLEDGVELGREAGGVLSVAHPHVHGPKRAREILEITVPVGLTGLEVHYGIYNESQRRQWQALADDFGLVATGGSDFHHETGKSTASTMGVDLDAETSRHLAGWLNVEL